MRTSRPHSLFILPLVLTLAAACGAGQNGAGASPDNSRGAGVGATRSPGGVGKKLYTDPDKAFAIEVPADWRIEREEAPQGRYLTVIRPGQNLAVHLSILTDGLAPGKTDSAELQSYSLADSSKDFFSGWIEALREQARVEGEGDARPTRFAGLSALQLDVTYYRGDADDPRRGRAIYFFGDKKTFFVALTASRPRFAELEAITDTLRIEP